MPSVFSLIATFRPRCRRASVIVAPLPQPGNSHAAFIDLFIPILLLHDGIEKEKGEEDGVDQLIDHEVLALGHENEVVFDIDGAVF